MVKVIANSHKYNKIIHITPHYQIHGICEGDQFEACRPLFIRTNTYTKGPGMKIKLHSRFALYRLYLYPGCKKSEIKLNS